MNEETCSGDVQGFTKPLGMDKRPTFKQFLKTKDKKKRKETDVLQKQADERSSGDDS